MRRLRKALFALTCAAGLVAGAAVAGDADQTRIVDGFKVYYGLVPVERLLRFPPGSDEAVAHAHIPAGHDMKHLVVAVFDKHTMARVADARVTARVAEIGFGWVEKTLEPTALNGYVTYCGYFNIDNPENYRIDFSIQRSDRSVDVSADLVGAEF